jgi:segregation and condensation protein B
MVMDEMEIKNAIECLIFVSSKPITLYQFEKILNIPKQKIINLIDQLIKDYENHGLQIIQVAGGYKICTRPEYARYIKKLTMPHPLKLSQASLETLAIIAYKQPITRPEIENIRGVNVDGVIETLLEKKLIKISGRKDAPGRPFIYSTTDEFLQRFGLKKLDDLPKMNSF